MANQGYLTLKGEVQGLISAGCSTQESIGNKCQTAHTDEIQVLAFVHKMSHVGNARHASHGPVVFTKNIDKSTPLLAQALAHLEKLECVIDFYRTSSQGTQEKFYTIELKGAVIIDLTTSMPHTVLQNNMEAQENVSIRYRKISWTHHLAGTSGHSYWGSAQ